MWPGREWLTRRSTLQAKTIIPTWPEGIAGPFGLISGTDGLCECWNERSSRGSFYIVKICAIMHVTLIHWTHGEERKREVEGNRSFPSGSDSVMTILFGAQLEIGN